MAECAEPIETNRLAFTIRPKAVRASARIPALAEGLAPAVSLAQVLAALGVGAILRPANQPTTLVSQLYIQWSVESLFFA
jgi:hypothetical protein